MKPIAIAFDVLAEAVADAEIRPALVTVP